MGRFLSWVLVLAAAVLIGWWGWSTFGPHSTRYAPSGKVDAELDAQPAPVPLPQAPLVAPKANTTGLPTSPIPYDQLKKGESPATAVAGAPPEKKSDEKAVFY